MLRSRNFEISWIIYTDEMSCERLTCMGMLSLHRCQMYKFIILLRESSIETVFFRFTNKPERKHVVIFFVPLADSDGSPLV